MKTQSKPFNWKNVYKQEAKIAKQRKVYREKKRLKSLERIKNLQQRKLQLRTKTVTPSLKLTNMPYDKTPPKTLTTKYIDTRVDKFLKREKIPVTTKFGFLVPTTLGTYFPKTKKGPEKIEIYRTGSFLYGKPKQETKQHEVGHAIYSRDILHDSIESKKTKEIPGYRTKETRLKRYFQDPAIKEVARKADVDYKFVKLIRYNLKDNSDIHEIYSRNFETWRKNPEVYKQQHPKMAMEFEDSLGIRPINQSQVISWQRQIDAEQNRRQVLKNQHLIDNEKKERLGEFLSHQKPKNALTRLIDRFR